MLLLTCTAGYDTYHTHMCYAIMAYARLTQLQTARQRGTTGTNKRQMAQTPANGTVTKPKRQQHQPLPPLVQPWRQINRLSHWKNVVLLWYQNSLFFVYMDVNVYQLFFLHLEFEKFFAWRLLMWWNFLTLGPFNLCCYRKKKFVDDIILDSVDEVVWILFRDHHWWGGL